MESSEPPSRILDDRIHGISRDRVLAEFDWIGRSPAEETRAPLLDVAAYMLDEDQLD